MIGTLVKIEIREGHTSSIPTGNEYDGHLIAVDFGGKQKHIDKLADVALGDMLFIKHGLWGVMKTSPIIEIIECKEDYIKFSTITSTYEFHLEEE